MKYGTLAQWLMLSTVNRKGLGSNPRGPAVLEVDMALPHLSVKQGSFGTCGFESRLTPTRTLQR